MQLTEKELNDVIKKMHSQKKFKQMVVFVEACESGSMFVNLSSTDSGKCLHGNSGWSRGLEMRLSDSVFLVL